MIKIMYKLDKKDKKILSVLDMDARLSISQIAKKVGLSKEVTNYRIKRLTEGGIIQGYYAVIDITRLGYLNTRLLLKFQNITHEKENELIEYCSKNKNIGWIGSIDGGYDIVLIIWSKDLLELKMLVDDIYAKFGGNIQSNLITTTIRIYHYKQNYLFNTKDKKELIWGERYDNKEISEEDKKILGILAKDGRVSLVGLANKIGISANTTKYRIKRLMEKKIILGFKTAINTHKLGYQHFKVFLYLQNLSKENKNKLIEYLRNHPNVIYITEAMGGADLEFEIMFKEYNQLYESMRNMRIKFNDIIRNYTTFLTYKEHLIRYFPD